MSKRNLIYAKQSTFTCRNYETILHFMFDIFCLFLFFIWERNLVFMSSEEEKNIDETSYGASKTYAKFQKWDFKASFNHTLSISFMK